MPFRHSLVFVYGLLLVLGHALPSTQTSETLSRDADSSKPLALSAAQAHLHDSRTVTSIVWSCVSTIIACCWVAIHPNMLEADAPRWKSTTNRLKHMLWMIIAPELIICWAMRQWVGVRNLRDKTPFKEAMIASYNQSHPKKEDARIVKKSQVIDQWSMTHGYFLQMGGFVLEGTQSEFLSLDRLQSGVNAKELALPNVTAKELNDRSKRDAFSKAVAIVQTTWFIAQCITRKIQGLVTTELELVTVAFAALNGFLYFFWWNKPLDVQTTVVVPILKKDCAGTGGLSGSIRSTSNQNQDDLLGDPRNPPSQASEKKKYCRSCSYVQFITAPLTFISDLFRQLLSRALFDRIVTMVFKSRFKPGKKKISTFYALNTTQAESFLILACAGLIGVLFGGIHCVGWNYFFPSHAERVIWHVSCIAITAIPALVALGALALHAEDKLDEHKHGITADFFGILGGLSLALGILGLIPYLVARVFLLVDAFISLRDLPADALLAVRWSSFLPHL